MSIFQKSKYRFVELFKKLDIIVSISRRISSLSKEAIWVQDLSGMFPSIGDQIIAKLCLALGYGDIFTPKRKYQQLSEGPSASSASVVTPKPASVPAYHERIDATKARIALIPKLGLTEEEEKAEYRKEFAELKEIDLEIQQGVSIEEGEEEDQAYNDDD